MKVKSLTVKNFTVFDKAAFEFSPGVNVLIGANATGKSHVLKTIYALRMGVHAALGPRNADDNGSLAVRKRRAEDLVTSCHAKFIDVFKPADNELSNLISRDSSTRESCLSLTDEDLKLEVKIRPNGNLSFPFQAVPTQPAGRPCIFIPPREALALFEGFQFAYANRELSFDGTYNDLCLALSGGALKGERAAWAKEFISDLERELDGKVQLKNNRFYVGKFEAHLVAEGLRKVASIVQLLRNGAIGKGSVLLWDEPEAGLNPRLMNLIASFLLQLASKGVQVFVATHDYILSSELSLPAEYETPLGKSAQPRFFCLTRESLQAPVTVEVGDVLAELRHNPILAEFAAHYDREHQLFISDVASDE